MWFHRGLLIGGLYAFGIFRYHRGPINRAPSFIRIYHIFFTLKLSSHFYFLSNKSFITFVLCKVYKLNWFCSTLSAIINSPTISVEKKLFFKPQNFYSHYAINICKELI